MLGDLVASLAQVGLTLHVKKTSVVTTETLPPQWLQSPGGVAGDVLDRACAHKWLGWLLHVGGHHNDVDIEFLSLNTFGHQCKSMDPDRSIFVVVNKSPIFFAQSPLEWLVMQQDIVKKNSINVTFRNLLQKVVGTTCHGLIMPLT